MKKLFTLVALLAMFLGANAQGGHWGTQSIYSIDYSTKTSFPFYVMGYVPEFDSGYMTDFGSTYRYATQEELEGDNADLKWKDGESSVGTVKNQGGTEYQKVTGAGPYWHQYFIADGIPTEIGGKYKVVAKVKASAPVNIDVNMGWGWGSGQQIKATVAIPDGADFQEVEWVYEGLGGSSCNLVAQPGTSTETIEWLSLEVYAWEKDNQRPKVWQEWLTDDGQPVTVTTEPIANWMGDAETPWADPDVAFNNQTQNYLICAWGKEKGVNTNDDGGSDPFPATIEEEEGVSPVNHVFVVHGNQATADGDAYKWDNQFWIQSPKEWKEGDKVKVSFRYKASKAVSVATQIHKQNPSDYLHYEAIGSVNFTDTWQDFEKTFSFTAAQSGGWSIAFNLNDQDKEAIDFYFDDLSWQSLVLDEGFFVSGINTNTTKDYNDLDNAIQFEEEDGLLVATVGEAKNANSYVNQIMISTVRGDDGAFLGATLKPEAIADDAEQWNDYVVSPNSKLTLPGLGVWKIYIDEEYGAMAFEMLEGTADEPEDIVTNETEIEVNGQEREDLKDAIQNNAKVINEEEDDPDPNTVGGEGHEGQTWDNQFFIIANRTLQKGEVTMLRFKYKASAEAKVSTQSHGAPGAYLHWAAIGDVNFTTDWLDFEKEFTVPDEADGMQSIAFNMAEIREACDYYIKDVQWYLYDASLEEAEQTWGNLIDAEGDKNFSKKEGAKSSIIPLGIMDVINDATTRTDVIYNLSGQRVSKDYKGIVIMNGRKVVNK